MIEQSKNHAIDPKGKREELLRGWRQLSPVDQINSEAQADQGFGKCVETFCRAS